MILEAENTEAHPVGKPLFAEGLCLLSCLNMMVVEMEKVIKQDVDVNITSNK